MPDQIDGTPTETVTPPDQGTPPASPAGGTPPAPEPASGTPAQPSSSGKKIITMPTDAMKRIKAEERQKGIDQARRERDAEARALGYRNWEDMKAKVSKQRGQQPAPQRKQERTPAAASTPPADPSPTPAAAGATVEHPRTVSRLERENQRLLERARSANQARAHEEKRSKRLQRQLDAQSAENELRLTAVRCGVQDVDYAISLLRREMSGKGADELKSFNEDEYFSKTLRTQKPYLYEIESRPATTTPTPTGKGGTTPTPTPTKKPDETPAGGPADAMKMSQEEYNKHLRKRGLTVPIAGMPG